MKNRERYTDTLVLLDDIGLKATPSPSVQDGVAHLLFITDNFWRQAQVDNEIFAMVIY